jgi:putative membrane protein
MAPVARSSAWIWAAFSLGLAVLIGLTAWQGLDVVVQTLGVAGARVLWLAPLFAAPLAATTVGWAALFDGTQRPPISQLLYARWVGFAVNQLLPAARVGGEIVRVRLVAPKHAPMPATIATVVADKTAQVATVALFAALGIGALAFREVAPHLLGPGLAGIALVGAAGGAFYVTQRRGGVDVAGRLLGRLVPDGRRDAWQAGTADVDAALRRAYRGSGFAIDVAANLLFRLALTIEVYLVLHFLGHPVDPLDALILEGLNQVLRAAAFMVPGALGAQETGFVVLGSVLGIPPPVALSVSLCKRARELLVGLPALAAWQLGLGRAWVRSSAQRE